MDPADYLMLEDDAYFADRDKDTQAFLLELMKNMMRVSDKVMRWERNLAIFGAAVVIFHLSVLCRKRMMTSSTNVILIGISTSDLFVLMVRNYQTVQGLVDQLTVCSEVSSYVDSLASVVTTTVDGHFRKCSTWLGMMLSLIRVIVITNTMNARFDIFSTCQLGVAIVVGVFSANVPISTFTFLQWRVEPCDPWMLSDACAALNITLVDHALAERDFFADNEAFVRRTYHFVDGLVSQFIPAAIFPILTVMLLVILQKTKKLKEQKHNEKRKDRSSTTTKLVVIMTITYLIYQLPTGIVSWYLTYRTLEPGIAQMITSFGEIYSIMFTINSITHCLICFGMSTQYRETVREILGTSTKPGMESSAAKSNSVTVTTY